ncbi:unnamed protein product [Didymodactylos carnosus]|uniref:Uncharacterized protein n=1 Tax=Didymodactylos carnosus TaxID=1234261 RepID=A0A816ANQ2_9BILA|nr:unnamed protein product [Didymodactylos carnosus]CAF1598216.1 unnamed protein product [Didymodactylos carnosus]CAF4039101.1 unnamed protein product [Didymodactylos carnosus]CAF4473990.1 unnamed protein product [Didymodactylos carnosus]
MQEHDLLKQNIEEVAKCDIGNSEIFAQIDKWENNAMVQIKAAAEQARCEVRRLVQEPVDRLSQITNDIRPKMQEEDYVEPDLEQWRNDIRTLQRKVSVMMKTIVVDTRDIDCTTLIKVKTASMTSKRDEEKNVALDFAKLSGPPTKAVKIGADDYLVGASGNHVLIWEKGIDFYLMSRISEDRIHIRWSTLERLRDVCWSVYLNRFIILGAKTLSTLDVETTTVNSIKQVSDKDVKEFWSCTCSGETLYVTKKESGSRIVEYNMSTWKMIKCWAPPLSCRQGEGIVRMRFNEDGSRVGVTLGVTDKYHSFELRDRSMTVLQLLRFPYSDSGYGLISFPSGQWLTIVLNSQQLHVIDNKGVIKRIIATKKVSGSALLSRRCIVLQTVDNDLCYYDL